MNRKSLGIVFATAVTSVGICFLLYYSLPASGGHGIISESHLNLLLEKGIIYEKSFSFVKGPAEHLVNVRIQQSSFSEKETPPNGIVNHGMDKSFSKSESPSDGLEKKMMDTTFVNVVSPRDRSVNNKTDNSHEISFSTTERPAYRLVNNNPETKTSVAVGNDRLSVNIVGSTDNKNKDLNKSIGVMPSDPKIVYDKTVYPIKKLSHKDVKDMGTNHQPGRKTIIVYHLYHGMLKSQAQGVDMTKCHHFRNCDLIYYDRQTNQTVEADAIVFQGNHMPNLLPPRFSSDQAFVYLNIESPQYLQFSNLHDLPSFFNWTATYRRDSDIPYWYGSVIPKFLQNETDILRHIEMGEHIDFKNYSEPNVEKDVVISQFRNKNYTDIFLQKTKSVVWFVSHCGAASMRDEYAEIMKTHVDIDIFGHCSNRSNHCPKDIKGCLKNVTTTYKFFLAFENSLCIDYITEKIFHWYTQDIIVEARGARHYKNYLPEGTYVDSGNFRSPVHLAQYLSKLGSDQEQYIGFLKRKDYFTVISGNQYVQLAYCNICFKINNLDKFRKPARNLKQWWITGKCTTADDLYANLG